MPSSPIVSLFLPLRVVNYPDQIGLGRGIGSCRGHLDGWMRPRPNSTPNRPFPKVRSSSFPLHAAHPCATVPISCTDHTCWQRLLVCVCARLARLCWHVTMVWGVIRAQLSEWRSLLWVSAAMQAGSGFAGRTGLCCFCLFVCSVPVSWSVLVLSVSISALLSLSLNLTFPSSSVFVSLSQQCAQQHGY